MLYFSKWKALAIVVCSAIICLMVVPSLLSPTAFEKLPSFMQRKIVLGLDLQGGSYIVLEVQQNDVRQARLTQLRDDSRRLLRDAKIGFSNVAIQGDAVIVRLRDGNDGNAALAKLRELAQPIGGVMAGGGQLDTDVSLSGDTIRVAPSSAGLQARTIQAVSQSIEIIRKRIDQLGTTEPSIQRQGSDRIQVQVPGLQDPSRLKALLGQTAQLTFRLVDTSVNPQQALQGRPPAGTQVLTSQDNPPQPYVIEDRVLVAGEDLTDAQPSFDPQTREPVVTFRFNTNGARRFAEATQQNVGKPFAIILDNHVISAPVIREPILGGSGQISGNFTVQQANDLAILLRAGALPVPLQVVEERTVGPGLGADSIRSGIVASIVGALAVALFMIATYGLFGVIAVLAVAVNVGMIFGILAMLGATLTLPGIAGVVLTVGIAVDSNVLIYERIREEARAGRSAISAIDAGFSRALATILDSNITTFIAAAVLFYIGSGPVRGFAITFGIGILTTVFTAFTLTRLMAAVWVRWKRPQRVPI
ncbi:protein translocase subunit SecD [Ancylobacter defluvii]|uniref:Protein translocase subunit SecD n=1 Tax=Ancylobacter defluvii TaxID=1282440 RepID=A0A9W6JW29_9HYPH|nr:protein translocase subunit SecD [Ancylobacter defluvii]MBS7587916.1 protein translocase subunit SecD [Ancylobacter defluvii]GLK83598.1 protein translocase subunit SecD [Ancylobacter defluvii]